MTDKDQSGRCEFCGQAMPTTGCANPKCSSASISGDAVPADYIRIDANGNILHLSKNQFIKIGENNG